MVDDLFLAGIHIDVNVEIKEIICDIDLFGNVKYSICCALPSRRLLFDATIN